ncbi:TetR family transcriptional regulator [Hoeflea sp.]|uniref:TetR/AcrR family transcriptional regulator n=1 Tax=Hoeflea sp. TaxID=1940281 RepID=UPI0019AC34F7|nr:TetR family transcriptional regulator [Hoeflea sp.]MBC7280573.1 TetR/AcrR family transcriptional regulator [Hoeflea sp.]
MRTVGSSREKTWPRVRTKGIDLICKTGFERMNLRKLAKESGIQVGSLYNYFSSKDEFLYKVICEIMSDLLATIEEAIEGTSNPVERLRIYVRTMVVWHCERRKEAYVSHNELKSLPKAGYNEVRSLRKRFEIILGDIVEKGCASGDFTVACRPVTVVAILNMLTSISEWYRPSGALRVELIVDTYEKLIGNMLLLKHQ